MQPEVFMNEKQSVRAKAIEIAVLIMGEPKKAGLSGNAELILDNYRFLVLAIEKYILEAGRTEK
jgi:hypothetical protein